MLFLFIFVFIIEYFVLHMIRKKAASAFLYVMGMYVAIVLINNLFAVKYGFFLIKNETIFVLIGGVSLFFVGIVIENFFNQAKYNRKIGNIQNSVLNGEIQFNKEILLNDNQWKFVLIYCSVVVIISLGRIALDYTRYGLTYLTDDDLTNIKSTGLVAHLLISVYVLAPVLLHQRLVTGKKKYSIVYVLILLTAFLSFVKYHVISILLFSYFYITVKNPKYRKRAFIILLAFIVVAFFSNYILGFMVRSIYIGNEAGTIPYLIKHLWTYISGGTINFNLIINNLQVDYDGSDFLISFLYPIGNMFYHRFIGLDIANPCSIPYIETMYPKVANDKWSNVLCSMGYIYGNGNLFWFSIIMILWGFITSYMYKLMKTTNKTNVLLCCCCYFSYNVLSFFGHYWGATVAPVEGMIFALAFPVILNRYGNKKSHVKWR